MIDPVNTNEFEQAKRFEQTLRTELQDFTVPAGFTARVNARLREQQAARRNRFWKQAVAAAVLLSAGLSGGAEMYHRAQVRKAEEATQQFALAMRITSHSLDAVNRAVNRLDKTNSETGEDQ